MDNQEYYRFRNSSVFIKLKMFYKKADNIRLSTKKYISPDVMGECNVFCFVQLKIYKVSIKHNRMMIKNNNFHNTTKSCETFLLHFR